MEREMQRHNETFLDSIGDQWHGMVGTHRSVRFGEEFVAICEANTLLPYSITHHLREYTKHLTYSTTETKRERHHKDVQQVPIEGSGTRRL